MSSKFLALVCVALMAMLLLAIREVSLLPDGNLHLHVFDVGQGDSTLLVSPSGDQILIDGGPDLSTLEHLGKHMPFLDRTIELLVLTHPDKDHVVALPQVLRRYRVERVLISAVHHNLGFYEAFLQALKDADVPVTIADPSLLIDIGDGLTLDILWPPSFVADTNSDTNMTSIVLRAVYGEHEILLTGDVDRIAENFILQSKQPLDADVIKIAHHGSRTSTSTGFLLAVDPDIALVSAGRDNRYGHPHREIVKRLEGAGVEVRTTAEEGTIEMEFTK